MVTCPICGGMAKKYNEMEKGGVEEDFYIMNVKNVEAFLLNQMSFMRWILALHL